MTTSDIFTYGTKRTDKEVNKRPKKKRRPRVQKKSGMIYTEMREHPTVVVLSEPRCTICCTKHKRENWIHQDKENMCHQLDCLDKPAPYSMPIYIKNTTTSEVYDYMTPKDTVECWKKIPNWRIYGDDENIVLRHNLLFHYQCIDLTPLNFKKEQRKTN